MDETRTARIFVFGSNEAGRHGKGAARFALEHHGAQYGIGVGLVGRSYAIPTKDAQLNTLPVEAIARHVGEFLDFARANPELQFDVTRVGCGLAGYTDERIAPLFANAPANCHLPESWYALTGAPRESRALLYAGIGSRQTPEPVLHHMHRLAARLAQLGYTLRSGGADGADSAFEAGCVSAGGRAEIWLPWRGFNGHANTGYLPTEEHVRVASTVHPTWERLSRGPRALHARNVGQALGHDLHSPVAFVLCWTPDGCEHESDRTRATGGTGTAIVLAERHGIPVVNLANEGATQRLASLVTRHPNPPTPLDV